MPSEFALIARYFTRPAPGAVLGVGDDAALMRLSSGMELAVSTDMLVAGRHFLPHADPYLLGYKALAVNLSDLAAMGARPRWATLALALPEADEAWLEAFSRGFFALARRHDVDLVGGDTTRGPLNLCVSILGEVPTGQALRRDGAQVGDDVWVSGNLGGAALGLRHLLGELTLPSHEASACLARLNEPVPRLDLGQALLGVAHAAIDISDGLMADLGHILERSGKGAEIHLEQLPAHPAVAARMADPQVQRCLLAGGDDYELCFTAAPEQAQAVLAVGARLGVGVARVGRITEAQGLRVLGADGREMGLEMGLEMGGYDHFA
jgi:thiamine-monophosphate kinase